MEVFYRYTLFAFSCVMKPRKLPRKTHMIKEILKLSMNWLNRDPTVNK